MANRPTNCITVTEAKDLQSNWVQTRATDIQTALGYEDTREFWFSIEELESFIAYVKQKTTEQNLQQPGVRIYFGAYPNEMGQNSYSTVFLAPTNLTNGRNKNNYNIDPLNHGTGGMPPNIY